MEGVIFRHERHARFGARRQNVLNLELAHNVTPRTFRRVVVIGVYRAEQNFVDLRDVRRDVIGLRIFNPLLTVRHDDDGHAVIVSRLDNRRAKSFRADALFVIGKNNRVEAVIEPPLDEIFQRVELLITARRHILKIHAEHLDVPAHDSDFGSRRPLRRDKPVLIDAAYLQLRRQRLKIMVVADEARHGSFATEIRQVVRDIRRRAE